MLNKRFTSLALGLMMAAATTAAAQDNSNKPKVRNEVVPTAADKSTPPPSGTNTAPPAEPKVVMRKSGADAAKDKKANEAYKKRMAEYDKRMAERRKKIEKEGAERRAAIDAAAAKSAEPDTAPARPVAPKKLTAHEQNDQAIAIHGSRLQTGTAKQKVFSARALGEVEDARSLPLLAGALMKDSDATVRIAAAYGLAQLGVPDAAPALSGALSDSDARVRAAAAEGLGAVSAPNGAALLAPALHDRTRRFAPRRQARSRPTTARSPPVSCWRR